MYLDICIGRVGKYIEEEYTRRFGSKRDRICDNKEIFGRIEKGVWRRR